ncbi:MAG: HAMP domain-containing protein, partial [Rhodospirillales bacterium]|nr:HAMP domain-containing protein [Rhodospirillales bacterium]
MRRVRLERKLAIVLLIAAVTSGVMTFAAMTGRLPGKIEPWVILSLINLDLVLLLALTVLIARRLVILWVARRRGAAGSRLHVRLVALFSLVAVTPTIIVALFSVILFDFGLQGWFSKNVSTAVKESLAVAQAYLEEHRQTISADALAMAQDLNRGGPVLLSNQQRFNQYVAAQAAIRSLTEAVIFDSSGRVLARAGFSLLLDFDPQIPDWALRKARGGEVAILTADTEDRVRALVRLDSFTDSYLYVGRLVDPRVLAHMDDSRAAAQVYAELEVNRADLQISFALIFVVVALLLLLAAVWGGLDFATYLTQPIGNLIEAADRVGAGDLSARVELSGGRDEIGSLSRSFNRMT